MESNANNLLSWQEVDKRSEDGFELNPIDKFIHEFEPADGLSKGQEFRSSLYDLIQYIIKE